MNPNWQAHACILVFDATRKNTYKNLNNWYAEMRSYRPSIPCICAVNKIDGNGLFTQTMIFSVGCDSRI
jgi:Rab-like protein 2